MKPWLDRRLEYILQIVGIATLYFISGKLGLQLAIVNPSTTPVWPPTGIALATFILFGYRIYPAIFLGAFFVNFFTAGSLATSIGIAFGNTLEGFVGAYLVNRFANGRNAFDKAQDVFKFAFFAAVVATTISATIGTITLLLGGYLSLQNYISVWITWWFGDAGGALIVAPLIIIWWKKQRLLWRRERILETFILFLFLIIFSQVIFSGLFPYIYLCVPLLMWIALRLSQKEAVSAIFILSSIAILNTLKGVGPFIKDGKTINEALLLLQLFMGTISITTLTVVAVVLERKKALGILEINQKHFRELIERSFDAILLIDKKGDILYANRSSQKQLGFSPQELVGSNVLTFIPASELSNLKKIFSEIIKSPGKSFVFESRFRHRNNSLVWIETTGTNFLREPNINAIVISFRNITERKQSEEVKERLATIVNSSKDAIYLMTLNGIVTTWNKGAKNMYGYKEEEIIGKSIEVIFPKDRIAELSHIMNTIKKGKNIENYETIRTKRSGIVMPVAISINPVKDSRGKIKEISVLARDITHEKELEKRKDEFISMASHELNTPITGLSVYTQTLQKLFKKKKDQEGNFYLSKMNEQLQRIRHLIRDLLDISRIRLGVLSFNYVRFDLNVLAHEIVEVFQYLSKKHKIKILGKIKQDIFADRDRIGQVLTNLLSNAIKYSQENSKIIVRLTSNSKEAIVSVQDFGVGIARKHQKIIFARLYRVQEETGETRPGLGIGLYLSFQIIERHKGRLWVESKKGKGSTFYFSLPYE